MSKLFKIFAGNRPDITSAQALAVVGWAASQAVAYGWITNATEQKFLSGAATVLAAAWKFADALLRSSRNSADAAKAAAKK